MFKQDSIWQLVDTGINDLGIQTFAPVKLVSGIGCVSNSSIANTPKGLMFLAEDGVYLFNGTPQVQKLSDPIDSVMRNLDQRRRPLASGVHWRTKNCYLLAITEKGQTAHNLVLVYDYKHQAWWIWDGMDCEYLARREDHFDNEQIFYTPKNWRERVFLDWGTSDHGETNTAYVQTHRLGYKDRITKLFRNCFIETENSADSVTIDVAVRDIAGVKNGTLDLTDSKEAKFGTAKFGSGTFVPKSRAERRISFRKSGEWATVKVTHTNPEKKFSLEAIHLGAKSLGRR